MKKIKFRKRRKQDIWDFSFKGEAETLGVITKTGEDIFELNLINPPNPDLQKYNLYYKKNEDKDHYGDKKTTWKDLKKAKDQAYLYSLAFVYDKEAESRKNKIEKQRLEKLKELDQEVWAEICSHRFQTRGWSTRLSIEMSTFGNFRLKKGIHVFWEGDSLEEAKKAFKEA